MLVCLASCRYELAYSAAGFGLGMQLGGTCIAFPKRLHQEETGGCMIGTEGGLLLKCQLDMNEVHMQAFSKVSFAGAFVVSLVPSAITSNNKTNIKQHVAWGLPAT